MSAAKRSPLTEVEIGQMLLEALALEVRALTLAQLLTVGRIGAEDAIITNIEAAQQRADDLVRGTYMNTFPGVPAARPS